MFCLYFVSTTSIMKSVNPCPYLVISGKLTMRRHMLVSLDRCIYCSMWFHKLNCIACSMLLYGIKRFIFCGGSHFLLLNILSFLLFIWWYTGNPVLCIRCLIPNIFRLLPDVYFKFLLSLIFYLFSLGNKNYSVWDNVNHVHPWIEMLLNWYIVMTGARCMFYFCLSRKWSTNRQVSVCFYL